MPKGRPMRRPGRGVPPGVGRPGGVVSSVGGALRVTSSMLRPCGGGPGCGGRGWARGGGGGGAVGRAGAGRRGSGGAGTAAAGVGRGRRRVRGATPPTGV